MAARFIFEPHTSRWRIDYTFTEVCPGCWFCCRATNIWWRR